MRSTTISGTAFSHFHHGLLALIFGLLIALTPVAADARNFCVNPGTTSTSMRSLAVGVKFTLPAKGSCSPFNGFDISDTDGRLVSGTACLDTDGHTLRVTYRLYPSLFISVAPGNPVLPTTGGQTLDVIMLLPYPSLQNGLGGVLNALDGSYEGSNTAHANWCIPANPRLPFP